MFAIVVTVGLLGSGGERIPEVVKAKEFQVVGKDGKVVLVKLGVDLSGHGKVEVSNNYGNPIVRLEVTVESQGRVATLDGKGEPLVVLDAYRDRRGGAISVLNGKGFTLAQIGVNNDRHGEVSTFDALNKLNPGTLTVGSMKSAD